MGTSITSRVPDRPTPGPLEGILVLDLSRVVAGPYCTMMLGDMGAEVIKIEQPGRGYDTREWGPPYAGGESAYYLSLNRNKRSATINLKHPRGQEIVQSMAARADILVENFKVGALDRLGLGYDQIARLNPRLVYCSITGFGPDGPYKDRPGYDFIAQAMGGIMSVTGEPDGPPMKVGVAIVDVTVGLFACSAILAALCARQRTGRGQRIDVSLLEAAVAWLINVGSNYLVSGEIPGRYSNAHPNVVPYQTFRTRDGYIAVAVGNDRQWQDFCQAAGRPGLARDERFQTNPLRVNNREALIPLLEELFVTENTASWTDLLLRAGVPCGPINNVAQVFADPQVLARQMLVEVPHPTAGTVLTAGVPYKLSHTRASVRLAPPLLGQHTEDVLRTHLGLTRRDIASLRREGVL